MKKDYLLKAIQSRVPLAQLERILDSTPGIVLRRIKDNYPREKSAIKFYQKEYENWKLERDREDTKRAREAVSSPYKRYPTL